MTVLTAADDVGMEGTVRERGEIRGRLLGDVGGVASTNDLDLETGDDTVDAATEMVRMSGLEQHHSQRTCRHWPSLYTVRV